MKFSVRTSWEKVQRIQKRVLTLFILGAVALTSFQAIAADWASVIMYHRFGESGYPHTNISIDQFQEHLSELKSGGYSVLPLGKIVAALESGETLPDRTVALTIDDAYLSVYKKAWPLLKEAGFPFTVFVSTDNLDQSAPDFVSWDQLREMSDGGVYIGHHSAGHGHLPRLTTEALKRDIRKASSRFEEKLGFIPALFAYPYGEYGSEIKKVVQEMGFKAAFGQQSGVAYSGFDPYAYPRFAMNENYGAIGRLRLAANALPLRVKDTMPTDNVLRRNPPAFGFSVAEKYSNLHQLSCYASNQSGGAVPIERIGETRVEVRLLKAFPTGRGRINCTLPGPEGRFRWFGSLYYIPKK
ncbi:MAG: polysaccharide deacetylase family protein [Sneathiella sp.]|nr:polysaccharide deacetylase family protein [Sneathiella sp.]